MRKVVIFIATSLDGYIAANDDDLSFLSVVEREGEDYGYNKFIKTVDTVIMGRKTFDKVMTMTTEFPHSDRECFVITGDARPSSGLLQYYNGNPQELVRKLKEKEGKTIFVDGGAVLINSLLKDNLIDELIISIIPVLLGEGIPLFKNGRSALPLNLIDSKSFNSGLVQLHYVKAAGDCK